MSGHLFLDTSFVQAMLNRHDEFHTRAMMLSGRLRTDTVWTTEAVLTEVGNALSSYDRLAAAGFIRSLYATANVRVVPVTSPLFLESLSLYEQRDDKDWGLTDCISFQVMCNQGLQDALTADKHFIQAGFRALLVDFA